MKILFISHDAGRTGAPLLILNMLRWFKESTDLSFEVLLLKDGTLRSEFAGIAPVHIFPDVASGKNSLLARIVRKLGYSPDIKKARIKLLTKLRKRNFSLIYANTITTGRALEALAQLECPVITHVHELNYWIGMSGENNFQQVQKYSTRYIAGSVAVKENLIKSYRLPADKIDVVHEFIPVEGVKADSSGIRKKFGIPDRAFVVLGSGHETWRKGKDLFVQLAALVHKASPELHTHFLWVGGWQKDEDRRNILLDVKTLGLTGRVHFTGGVTNTHNYFAAGDIFTMVSREDPFPLVCLEAALLGKPVLCFADAGGMPEFVEEDAGFISPYLNLEAMTEKIISLATDEAMRIRLGSRAAEKVRDLYNVETGARKIEKIIRRELESQTKCTPVAKHGESL